MDAIQTRQYAIELFVDGRWQELQRSADRAEMEVLWAKLSDLGLRAPARFVEIEVLRASPGEAAA